MPIFGFGQQKPHHFLEMAKVAWENRDELPFAWRILKDGVCDGCALGTSGMSDWTIPGTHLCMVRLELMREHGARPRPQFLPALRRWRSITQELRALAGCMNHDSGKGQPGSPRSHGRALDRSRGTSGIDRARLASMTSRGIIKGCITQHRGGAFSRHESFDNSARLCHAASTAAMKATLGYGAATCSYADWLHADLIVLFGSNVANNQPVTTKYLHYAKRNGAEIAVVNPYREPGLGRYWIPSIVESALSGTALADHWFDVDTGGDLAFLVPGSSRTHRARRNR